MARDRDVIGLAISGAACREDSLHISAVPSAQGG